MSKRNRWTVIGRGKAGWHAMSDPEPWVESEGYRSRIGSVSSSGGNLDEYAREARAGAFVYDAEEADADAFTDLVFAGPMLSLELAPDGVRKFGDAERSAALLMCGPGGLEGAFLHFALRAQDEKFSGLDYVGLHVYAALLRKVPGIRFGRVEKGVVEWEVNSEVGSIV